MGADQVTVFESDGIRFCYETQGKGEPVILLHGLGGNRAQALGLAPADKWQRVALELRGHGDTAPVGRPDAFNFPTFADDLARFMDHIDVASAVVGGVSMGAGVALRLALDHADRVRALVLVRPAWLNESLVESQPVWNEIAYLLQSRGPKEGLKIFRASDRYAQTRLISEYAAESLCHQFTDRDATDRVPRLVGLPGSSPYDSPADLSGVQIPALVLGADLDPQHPLEFAHVWADLLPEAQFGQVVSKAIDPAAHTNEVQSAVGTFLHQVLT